MRNLEHQPRLEINFFDLFIRKAVRVRGRADVLAADSEAFGLLFPRFADHWPDLANRIRHIVQVHIEAASIVTTPPYDDGATEADMIALYKRKVEELYP